MTSLRVTTVGTTPFSTGDVDSRVSATPMHYVMSFPTALHELAAPERGIHAGRNPENFFHTKDKEASPTHLKTTQEQALCPRASMKRKILKPHQVTQTELPRDTLHPLLSLLQAEENAKANHFYPHASYLANARRDGPPCVSHQPTSATTLSQTERKPDEHEEDDFGQTVTAVKRFAKRGDLSTFSGRAFYTDGNFHDPTHYASNIVEFATSQPSTLTGIAAKALGSALHFPSGPAVEPTSTRLISASLRDELARKGREGRHAVAALLVDRHAMLLPKPLIPDKGVVSDAVSIPQDPFAQRHFKAVQDGPETMDSVHKAPSSTAEALGAHSHLHLWTSLLPSFQVKAVGSSEQSVPQVLSPSTASFFSGNTCEPSVSHFLNDKGIRQSSSLKQPTQLSKSSLSETGVIPSSQFTDLELMPPNAVGFDSERLSVLLRNYGKDFKDILLGGAFWIDIGSLQMIGRYCASLVVLDLSQCQQINDALIENISVKCKSLRFVNLSGTPLSGVGLKALLENSTLEGLFLSDMASLDRSADVAWSELHRHGKLRFLDISFSFEVTNAAAVAISQYCPRVEALDISGCGSLTDTALLSLAYSLKHLKVLRLKYCQQFSSLALAGIGVASKQITDLDLTGISILDVSLLNTILPACPKLQRLNLRSCVLLDDDSVITIGRRCVGIEHLDLSGCVRVSSAGVMQLIHLQKGLKSVNLSETRASKAEIRLLQAVRESCLIKKSDHTPWPVRKLNAYRQIEVIKKVAADKPRK